MDINEKVQDDKENLQNFDFQRFSHQVKIQRKTQEKQKLNIKFAKTAQIFDIKNEQNPLQNFQFINDEILPVQGITFPKEEVKQINNALKYYREQEKKNFLIFGKVLCTQKDYLIIFSNDPKQLNEEEQTSQVVSEKIEQKGVNKFDFRIFQNGYENWKKLDMVSSKQVRQSRHVNIYLSGDLDKDLNQYGFEGTEQNYLCCQLIRILSSCYCVPSSYYKFEEDIKDIQIDNETMSTFFQSKEDVQNLDNWVHRFPIVLKSGRIKHFIPLHRNDEDKEQLKDELDENDPNCDRLRVLTEDTENLWKFKYYGKREQYIEKNSEDDEEKQKQIGNVVMTNKNWNGAMNIFSINYQISTFLYIGYGFKNPLVNLQNKIDKYQVEPKQRKEQLEPNHHEEPEQEQNDEDDEQQEEIQQDIQENEENLQEQQDQQKEEQDQINQQIFLNFIIKNHDQFFCIRKKLSFFRVERKQKYSIYVQLQRQSLCNSQKQKSILFSEQ